LKTLSSKLALVLFALVICIGIVFLLVSNHFVSRYQNEVTQSLHAKLAANLVKSNRYIDGDNINHTAVMSAFETLMVINPAIEVYLLDPLGKILSYSAPEGQVKRTHVSTQPITQFMQSRAYPILGDDPRSDQQKVFSVEPIYEKGRLKGFLYIVLHSQLYQNTAEQLENSYLTRISIGGILAGLVLALGMGIYLFRLLTRRLTTLNKAMQSYGREKNKSPLRYKSSNTRIKDEVDSLGMRFNQMADQIDEALDELLRNDSKRRELIANVSHDLRTPLATLHGYLETLSLKAGDLSEDEREQYLNIALKQSENLSELVNQLFELAKLDSCETLLNVEAFSLAELAQDVAQKFILAAKRKGVHIEVDLKEIPFAYGDIALIQRVLENLIENAIRHTPKDGRITIGVRPETERIAVEIRDTGVGIPKESIQEIFERFFRVDKERGASNGNAGLGLAIVKRILNLHGSSIDVHSEVQKGTCFSFDLPVQQF